METTVSVVVPCRNEKGNIEAAVERIPDMGKNVEIIFIEGHSTDGTFEECERVKKQRPDKNVKIIKQPGIGKGDAVRAGVAAASGDVAVIFDADLTSPPEDIPKFFQALIADKGELIMGNRMVYQMEEQAMRMLNIFGNKFFSTTFSFLLSHKIRDTLCGTKVFWRNDYERILSCREYFGDFDPFGDFELIFGAAKLNMQILEIPTRYRARVYGETQIDRFRHGWLLLKMAVVAAKKLRFM
jgi:glycosyltransferase involved in cell wall biosynthesis